MSFKADPSSDNQIQTRARRMQEGPWTHKVIEMVAFSLLLELEGESSRVNLDLLKPEDRKTLEALIQKLNKTDWDAVERRRDELMKRAADGLMEALKHTKHLGAGFYSYASRRVGELLTEPRSPHYHLKVGLADVRGQDCDLSLPPKDHPRAVPPDMEEEVAMELVAWKAARGMWQSLGNPEPDELGRCGLSRPEVMEDWAEKLGLLSPQGKVLGTLSDASPPASTCLPLNRQQDALHAPNQGNKRGLPGHWIQKDNYTFRLGLTPPGEVIPPERNPYEYWDSLALLPVSQAQAVPVP